MWVRPISSDELHRFAKISFPPDDAEAGRQAILALWESGASRPAWCFVVENGADWLGGVCFRSRGGGVSFYDLQIAEDNDYFEIGSRLLQDSLRQLYEQGVTQFQRNIQSDENHADKWRRLLNNVRIPLVQEKNIVYVAARARHSQHSTAPQLPGFI